MATWIAHLRIAESLLGLIPDLSASQFAIGNIAPDSGIPDENWEKFDPPPAVTHFKRTDSVHKEIADLDFYRRYLADLDGRAVNRFSFRLGYFFHLITDNLWTIQVGRPTQERYPQQFAAERNFIWEVKKDWYGLDHLYVREHPECLFWRVFLPFDFAQGEPDSADLDFLPPQALSHQVAYIKSYYQRRDDEINQMLTRPFEYLSKAEMDCFVTDAISRLHAIYQILWPQPPPLDGIFTALDL